VLKGWRQLCLTLIDYVAYFDKIKIHKLKTYMKDLNMKPELANFMIGIAQDTDAKIDFFGEINGSVKLESRIAQGSIWAPELATLLLALKKRSGHAAARMRSP
jgi:hypothetical protein